jgi:hypothetical protein
MSYYRANASTEDLFRLQDIFGIVLEDNVCATRTGSGDANVLEQFMHLFPVTGVQQRI